MKISFEKALNQLEEIVRDMESDKLTLEQALKKFEEGMKLSKYCAQKLDETEKKITMLVSQADGSLAETAVSDEESE